MHPIVKPPPGWYPDPWVAGRVRYFDGHGWTPHGAPAEGSAVSAQVHTPGWYPDPWGAGMRRYFDGHSWTADCTAAEVGQSVPRETAASVRSSFSVDRAASDRRKVLLESYLSTSVWNPDEGFVCKSAIGCRSSAEKGGASFYEAQGHMVGPCYDIRVDDVPHRVVVVPMETGETKQHRTVEQRTQDVLNSGTLTFGQRNQHMRGVTFALRLAFGLPVDADTEHIHFDDGSNAHLFDAYAMTNLLLCSAVDHGTAKSRATAIMRNSCSRHLRETLKILQPTLVISQGAGLDKTLSDTFGITQRVTPSVATCDQDGNRFVWVSLRHPSRGNWSSLKCAYLHEVVVPAITKGRALALAGQ